MTVFRIRFPIPNNKDKVHKLATSIRKYSQHQGSLKLKFAFCFSAITLLLLLAPSWPGRKLVADSNTTLPAWLQPTSGNSLVGRILPYRDWSGREWFYVTQNPRGIEDQPVFRISDSAFPQGCCIDWFSTGWNALRIYTNNSAIPANGNTDNLLHPAHRSIQRGYLPPAMLKNPLQFGVLSDKHGGIFFRVTTHATPHFAPFKTALLQSGGWFWLSCTWLAGLCSIILWTIAYATTGQRRHGVLALTFAFLFGALLFEHPYRGMGGMIDLGDDSYYVAYTQNLLQHGNWFKEPTTLQVGKRIVEHNHGLPGLSLFLAPGAIIQSEIRGTNWRGKITLHQLRGMRLASATYSLIAIILLFLTLNLIHRSWMNIPLSAFLLWGTSLSQWTYNRCIFTHSTEMMLLCALLYLALMIRQNGLRAITGIPLGLLFGLLLLVRGEYLIAWPLIPWIALEGHSAWPLRRRLIFIVCFVLTSIPFEAVNLIAAHKLTTGYGTAGATSIIHRWSDIGSANMWRLFGQNCRELLISFNDAGIMLLAGTLALIVLIRRKLNIPAWSFAGLMLAMFIATASFPIPLGSEWQHRYALKLYPIAILSCAMLIESAPKKQRRIWSCLLLLALGFSFMRQGYALARHEAWSAPSTTHGNGFFLLSDLLLTTKGMSDPEWLTIRYSSLLTALALSVTFFSIAYSRISALLRLSAAWLLCLWIPFAADSYACRDSQLGFAVEYFKSPSLDGPVAQTDIEDFASIEYGGRSPHWSLWRHRNYSARWSGMLHVPRTADYDFFLEADDGARLWLDGNCLINNWDNREWQGSGRHANVRLTTGTHSIVMEHCKLGPTAAIRLKWSGGDIPANTILGIPFVSRP